jgi:hypothetical protein
MALDISPRNMRDELESGGQLLKKHLGYGDELVADFVGSDYREDMGPDIESHENHCHEVVANTLPHLLWDNPKVDMRSGATTFQRLLIRGLTAATNRWIESIDLSDPCGLAILDSFFWFGCTLTTMAPVPGHEDNYPGNLLPRVTRISPRRVRVDPQALTLRQARWISHMWVRDKQDLLKAKNRDGTPRFDQRAVKALKTDTMMEEAFPDHSKDARGVTRESVVGFEVWVPEHGLILTIGYDGENGATFLRKPRRAVCPPWGPYTFWGIYHVPDQIYPLPLLSVTKGLVAELNAHIDQASTQADQARSFTLANATNDKMVAALKAAEHGSIQAVPGFDSSQVEQVTIDGPSKESLDYIDRLRSRVDRKSGITQTIAGNITGATKGEVDSADARADVRLAFQKRQTRKCMTWQIKTGAWFLANSPNVKMLITLTDQEAGASSMSMGGPMGGPMEGQDPAAMLGGGMGGMGGGAPMMGQGQPMGAPGMDAGGMGQPGMGGMGGMGQPMPQPNYMGDVPQPWWFVGGVDEDAPPEQLLDFDALQIEIQPYTMEFVDQRVIQANMQTAFATVIEAGQLMPTMPWIRWGPLLDDYFQTLNVRDGRKYFDFQYLQMMSMAQGMPPPSAEEEQGVEVNPQRAERQGFGDSSPVSRPSPLGLPAGPSARPQGPTDRASPARRGLRSSSQVA